VPPQHCNLAKSFSLLGDRWALLILRSALYGLRRFEDFQTELDISRSVLSDRLQGLVEGGLMERREYRESQQRPRAEYPLTEMGKDLSLPFIALTQWGDRWQGGKNPPPMAFRSRSKNITLRVALVDDAGREVEIADVAAVIRT
jgi:DNA-binding HxlR family transcriptional regulator